MPMKDFALVLAVLVVVFIMGIWVGDRKQLTVEIMDCAKKERILTRD